MKKILIILSLFISFIGFSQKILEKPNFSFSVKDYYDALIQYKEIIDNPSYQIPDSTRLFIYFRIGECYKQFLHYHQAGEWFEKALTSGFTKPQIYLSYASTLIMEAHYEKASDLLEKYMESVNYNPEAELLHRSCEFAIRSAKENTIYIARNQSELNTEFSDYGLAWTRKGKLLISSSRGERDPKNYYKYNGQPYSDFFYSYLDSATHKWIDPIKLKGDINSPYNEGTITYLFDNKTAFYMQCNGLDGKDSTCNIYYSKYDEKLDSWSKPKIFEINSKSHNIGHPTMSDNGKIIFFVSDMPGGIGKKDIWYSTIDNSGKWSKPINAGTLINTEQDEIFPYIFEDSILYFSSNGRVGFGGLDIFYSKFCNGIFSRAENLETPFNSSADDFGICLLDWDSGFFCSNRSGGKGDDDIFSFKQIRGQIKVSGLVTDNRTGNIIDHSFVIIQGTDGSVDSTWTDSKGYYSFSSLAFNVDYVISAHKEGYLGDSKNFSTKNVKKPREVPREKRYIMDLQLDLNLKVDLDFKLIQITKEEVKINNIYYDFGRWDLRDSSKIELDKLVHLLNVNPSVKILINSHTDARSSEDFNMKLSQNRAQSVVNYLIEKGVASERLFAKGWGKSKLLIRSAISEEEHQLNRRTTFSIVNFSEVADGYANVKYDNIPNIHGGAFPDIPREILHERNLKEGLVLKIQIAASRNLIADQTFIMLQDSLKDYKIEYKKYKDGIYRYTIGNFNDYKEANFLLEKVQKFGVDAMLIATQNDMIVPLNVAVSPKENFYNKKQSLPEKNIEVEIKTKQEKKISEQYKNDSINKNPKNKILKEDVVLKVQIASSRFKITDKNFEVIRDKIPDIPIDILEDEDGLYRYSMGEYVNYDEANRLIEKLETIGYKAFLIAYKDGKRISLFDAIKSLDQNKNKEIKNTTQTPRHQETKKTEGEPKEDFTKNDSTISLRIQIAASKNLLPDSIFANIRREISQFSIDRIEEDDGYNRYYLGIFSDYDVAQLTIEKLNKLGHKAFLVAFRNNKKMSLSLALKYLKTNKNP